MENKGTYFVVRLSDLGSGVTPDNIRSGFLSSHPGTRIHMLPSCYSGGKQMAIIECKEQPPDWLFVSPDRVCDWVISEELMNRVAWGKDFSGLTQLYRTQSPVVADVVVVAGIDGDAYNEWRGEAMPENMWLRDFLGLDLPQFRTMLFGCTKQDGGARVSSRFLAENAENLLNQLKMARRQVDGYKRPLILMGYGVGCALILVALEMAARWGKISIENVRGIIFLGPEDPKLPTYTPRSKFDFRPEDSLGKMRAGNLLLQDSYFKTMVVKWEAGESFTSSVRSDVTPGYFSVERECHLRKQLFQYPAKIVKILAPPDKVGGVSKPETGHAGLIRLIGREDSLYQGVLGHLKRCILDHDPDMEGVEVMVCKKESSSISSPLSLSTSSLLCQPSYAMPPCTTATAQHGASLSPNVGGGKDEYLRWKYVEKESSSISPPPSLSTYTDVGLGGYISPTQYTTTTTTAPVHPQPDNASHRSSLLCQPSYAMPPRTTQQQRSSLLCQPSYAMPPRTTATAQRGASLSPNVGGGKDEYLRWKYVAEFGKGTVTTRKDHQVRGETWKNERRIGEGGFGAVYQQIRIHAPDEQPQPGRVRAVKSITQAIGRDNRKTIMRELNTLIALRYHTDSFVEFYGWYEDEAKTVYIAMEYISGGDLHEYILQDRARAKENCKTIATQILTAIDILHENQICHRDLKPQNVLVKSLSPIKVKLADFGIARSTSRDATGMKTMIGTSNYMAPEVLRFSSYGKAGMVYTQAVDTWAFGILTHELYTGKIPFSEDACYTEGESGDEEISGAAHAGSANDGESAYFTGDTTPEVRLNALQLVEYCRRGNGIRFPDLALREANAPDSLSCFIKCLLYPDPLKRPPTSNALLHPWITGRPNGQDHVYPCTSRASNGP